MSAPHKFKAQLMEVYIKSVFPDADVLISTGVIDLSIYVHLNHYCQTWTMSMDFRNKKILDEDFENLNGYSSISVPDEDRVAAMRDNKMFMEHFETHISFSEFAKHVSDMKEFAKKISKDISKVSYEGSPSGFSIKLVPSIKLTYNPRTDFRLTYIPVFRGFRPSLNESMLGDGYFIASHTDYMCEPETVIEKIRSLIIRIIAFDSKYKSLIKVKLTEIELGVSVLEQEHQIE